MNPLKPVNLLNVVFDLWGATLGPTEFKIVAALYRFAASTSDRKISKSIQKLAGATDLSWRTVQTKLHELNIRGVIEILSANKERMLIKIPQQHWSPVNNPKPVVEQPASIPELIFRLTGQRPSPETLAYMRDAAEGSDERLQICLDTFWLQGKRWTTLELLTVAVQHDLRSRTYFSSDWGHP